MTDICAGLPADGTHVMISMSINGSMFHAIFDIVAYKIV